jgi:hypothetical protein
MDIDRALGRHGGNLSVQVGLVKGKRDGAHHLSVRRKRKKIEGRRRERR